MSIRIGIIGAGGMANYHIPGVRQGGAKVVAIADIAVANAQKVADKFGIAKVYSDAAEMIAKEQLDAVCVITRPS